MVFNLSLINEKIRLKIYFFDKAGMLYLYEKNGMYQRILQYHMDNNEYANILDTCKRYGTQDSNLWIQALQYFSKREEVTKLILGD